MDDNLSRVNRRARIIALATALVSALVATEAISTPSVVVSNVPLPVDATITLPAEPFHAEMSFVATDGFKAVGVPGRRLAVTSITIMNANSDGEDVLLFNPFFSGSPSDCASGTVVGGGEPQVHLILEARKTMQLEYPTPLVFEPHAGLACFAAGIETTHTLVIYIGVTGFTVEP